MSTPDLRDRTAVITGGSRGIGLAIAERFASGGAAVLLAGRDERALEEASGRIRAGGGKAWRVSCDVADPRGVEALALAAERDLGRVDILVNGAGISVSAPLRRITFEEWNRVLAVNAGGTFLCARAFLPAMLERGWGRVINIASTAGLVGGRYIAAYAASKHAVIGFTRSIAAESAGAGVTCNALCPGYVDTDMTRGTVQRVVERTGKSSADALSAVLASSGQSRLIRPGEVAHAALFLCSEEAGGINGQALVIDGGSLLA